MMNPESISLGVSLGAMVFAALWFIGFRRAPIKVFSGLVVALYVGLAFGVGSDFYPVSRFGMYAQITAEEHRDPAPGGGARSLSYAGPCPHDHKARPCPSSRSSP